MKLSSTIGQARITRMGAMAHARLAPGQRGKVLAAFSNAIYLLTDDADLCWIVSDNAPMHRRALKISSRLSVPAVGSRFRVKAHRLTIDPGFTYGTEQAWIWPEPQISREHTIEITEIPARAHALFSSLDLSRTRGFGNFIPDVLRRSHDASTNPQTEALDPIILFARPFVLDMARACLENHPSRLLPNVDALIGLGAGLTPSGDDFAGGFLFCIKTLQSAYPELNFDNPISLDLYRARTHPISFALLQDLADGHAIAPLYQLANELLSGESFETMRQSILQLTHVGHSTGWDLLAGFVTGLLSTYRSAQWISSFCNAQSIQA